MNLLKRLFGAGPERPVMSPELERRIRASFDESSADEEHFPSTIDPRIYHVQLILRTLGDLNGKRVLDAGCGKGRFARVLREQYPDCAVAAMDLSEAMLGFAPRDLWRVSGTLTSLPFATGAFDGVYATESLEHAVDVPAAVAELCRVLRPGGRVIIMDKNAEQWGRFKTPEWERWFERKELEKMLGRHCREVSSQFVSYWEDVAPDGLFLAWTAVK
ncbi:MAG: methyltransferase domain-containing protein [Acidobacteria bacterium]|nr:methyltransferase domain-containing protein [Acidobacteriota bacterium]